MTQSKQPLKIGISACFFHPNEERSLFKGKTLQYIEQSVAHWIMSQGDLAVMIPSPQGSRHASSAQVLDYAAWLDGVVLMGGTDVWPGSYGEKALQPDWQGDRIRDEYDKQLIAAFSSVGKPVLGICRGMQIINVAYGGSLYQDIPTQIEGAHRHRDSESYDLNAHELQIKPESRLSQILGGLTQTRVNSIHHQCVKVVAPGFDIEAYCPHDNVPEAIRRRQLNGESYVAAIQWHPEFHRPDLDNLDDSPLLSDFLDAARMAMP